jgi:hypothetical protein
MPVKTNKHAMLAKIQSRAAGELNYGTTIEYITARGVEKND